ncbi:hypothetical protein TNCV_2126631 [Trichonephila clavipes]|nr:hypothetical protein TNCV_2126631 [Trichonephila clavipes]
MTRRTPELSPPPLRITIPHQRELELRLLIITLTIYRPQCPGGYGKEIASMSQIGATEELPMMPVKPKVLSLAWSGSLQWGASSGNVLVTRPKLKGPATIVLVLLYSADLILLQLCIAMLYLRCVKDVNIHLPLKVKPFS